MGYSPEIKEKARQLYEKNGLSCSAIGDELGIPSGTVSSWRSRENWKQKKRKRAKQKNRKGNPDPKPVIKHGGYSAIYWDSLDPEEQALINQIETNEESLVIDQIKLFSVRERRLLTAIAKYKDPESGSYESMTLRTEKKREFEDLAEEQSYKEYRQKQIFAGKRAPGTGYDLVTEKRNADDMILRLEKELTSVQAKKNQAINTLHAIREDRLRLENESGNNIVEDWIKAVLEENDIEIEDDEEAADNE